MRLFCATEGTVHICVHQNVEAQLFTFVLSHCNVALQRPTMPELISWIDVETLLLLFSMMMLVAILSETGIFDYLAVYAYKVKQIDVA